MYKKSTLMKSGFPSRRSSIRLGHIPSHCSPYHGTRLDHTALHSTYWKRNSPLDTGHRFCSTTTAWWSMSLKTRSIDNKLTGKCPLFFLLLASLEACLLRTATFCIRLSLESKLRMWSLVFFCYKNVNFD